MEYDSERRCSRMRYSDCDSTLPAPETIELRVESSACGGREEEEREKERERRGGERGEGWEKEKEGKREEEKVEMEGGR